MSQGGYLYAIVFLTGAGLGVVGLVRDSRRRFAIVGILMNLAMMGWRCGHFYVHMKDCAARGWMRMPWPFD